MDSLDIINEQQVEPYYDEKVGRILINEISTLLNLFEKNNQYVLDRVTMFNEIKSNLNNYNLITELYEQRKLIGYDTIPANNTILGYRDTKNCIGNLYVKNSGDEIFSPAFIIDIALKAKNEHDNYCTFTIERNIILPKGV